jgi:hypothetical protein
MYKFGAIACLLPGIFGGIWFNSFWLGVCFFIGAILYHSHFIARQQDDLAQFWSEGDDQSVGRALRSGCVQYTIFIGVLLLFFNGALSRCSGPSTRHGDTEARKSTPALLASSVSPPLPPRITSSQLDAADHGNPPSSCKARPELYLYDRRCVRPLISVALARLRGANIILFSPPNFMRGTLDKRCPSKRTLATINFRPTARPKNRMDRTLVNFLRLNISKRKFRIET